MRYLIAAHTDVGIKKKTNQDSYMIKEAQIFCFQPGMIPGYGMGNSIELNLQDKTGGDMTTFYNNAMKFLGAMVWVACRMENWPVRP